MNDSQIIDRSLVAVFDLEGSEPNSERLANEK